MNSISVCIDSLIAIDDQVFLAECDVMLANDIWLNKMSDMIKYSGNSDSMIGYIQEADYGRRDTGGNQWLSKLRIFILKCIDKIVDAVTNFLLKIKTRKAEYIRIPYKYEDLMEDINLVKSIDKEIYQIFDNVESFASVDNAHKLMAIKEKLRNTHFAKNQRFMISAKDPEVHNKLNKYGIKPDQYMKLAKELRDLNRALKDTKTRASKMVQKEWLKDPNSIDKPRVVVQELLFNIYTEMSKMMVKLMQSFTVFGVEKMDQAVIEKKIKAVKLGIIKLQKTIDESVEYDINDDDELEFFDETEKPFDDYLKKHKYDPDTNTIEISGKRVNFGKKLSTKEKNRANRFLRENDYDPKTETIKTDIKLPSGRNHRIKFNMNDYAAGTDTDAFFKTPALDSSDRNSYAYDAFAPTIHMSPKYVSKKPRTSNQTYKHEEGHYNQYNNYYDNVSDGLFKPRKETKENIENFMSKNRDVSDVDSHYNSSELDADLYGYQHNPYASKAKTNKSQMNYAKREITKYGEKEKKKVIETAEEDAKNKKKSLEEKIAIDTKYDIEKYEADLKTAKEFFKIHQDTLVLLQNLNKSYGYKSDDGLDIKTSIHESLKGIEELENRIKTLKNTPIKDSEKYRAAVAEIATEKNAFIKNMIYQIDNYIDACNTEIRLRNKFLNRNKEEAASQARKLEGRQGKHKGKK